MTYYYFATLLLLSTTLAQTNEIKIKEKKYVNLTHFEVQGYLYTLTCLINSACFLFITIQLTMRVLNNKVHKITVKPT